MQADFNPFFFLSHLLLSIEECGGYEILFSFQVNKLDCYSFLEAGKEIPVFWTRAKGSCYSIVSSISIMFTTVFLASQVI